ncbi:hypothetical protein WJX75_009538 [Coccomyxa subellipsoidea]|uniref:Prolamin-like domain-containing protein n=1 Tax=Coccomyxa subellipsoidea TaxID=248742 RepID=A0ABR2YDC3_9CHLO
MRRTAVCLLALLHLAAPGLCADSRRHLTQGGPQQPPLLPLPAFDATQQQAYLPQWSQAGPQQSFAAAQQAQQQQQLRQQQQQQPQQHTSFDNLVKTSVPSAGPALAQTPAAAPAPGISLYSAFAPSAAQGNKCTEGAKWLVTGACFDFVAPFGADYGQLASLGDADFRQAVALGPTPTDQCCEDARTFVTGACACDALVAAAAPALGMRAEAFPLVAKAAVMACPHYNIVNSCQ